MEDFTRVVFQNAITKERLARQMYLDFAKKAESDEIKNIFLKLADEEQIHEQLFNKMDISTIKKVNGGMLKNLRLLEEVDKEKISIENKNELNNTLDFAIREEQKAYEDYNLLMNHLDFGEPRELLKEIAQQELKHRTMLQKIKLGFNDDDWSFVKVPDR